MAGRRSRRSSVKFHLSIPLDKQSIEQPGGERISHYCKDGQLLAYRFEDAKTLYEAFIRGKNVSGNGECLGWREKGETMYKWLSYSQVEESFMNFGSGLAHVGIPPGQDSFIGVYAANSIQWTITELSSHAYSRIIVALYDTLGHEAITHIINQADIKCVICGPTNVKKIIQQANTCPNLKLLVVMGSSLDENDKKSAEEAGMQIFTFSEIEEFGKANPVSPELPNPDYLTTVCYTSGTTGLPKGVMLTHGNAIANISGMHAQLEEDFELGPSDVHLSYLPLAHMLERCTQAILFMNGSKIGFFSGDIKSLVEDIQILKPTIFISVPRLLNRIYDKVMAGVQSSKAKKWLFDNAYQSKLSEVKNGVLRRDSMWDWLVFGRIQKLLGGNIRGILSSSAPISDRVMEFYQVAFGCYVMEGYGQTECTSASTMSLPADTGCGNVGPPIPCSKVKVVDVPELNYYANNGEGEVCFWGPHCCKGYLKEPEKTRELIDEDGWVHSGDIGKWLPNGTLKITDRVKHIFKLAQGEYIAPEKVENVCCRSSFIAQMFLYGDSLRSACVAVVIPDEEVLVKWATDNGRGNVSFDDLCLDEDVKRMIFDDLQSVGRKDGLNSLEIPKAIKLSSVLFSIENELLTPTFKVKRPFAKKHFKEDIDELYSQLPA